MKVVLECLERGGDCPRGRRWETDCNPELLSGLVTLYHAQHEGHRLRLTVEWRDSTGDLLTETYEPPA